MIKRLSGTCVLVLSVLAFAGSASAGNGNGNGNGNGGQPVSSDAAPGNSGSAPGQQKKDLPPAAEQTVAAPPAAPSEGVKPSSDTAKDTHAAASSNETKQYGNDQTAGEIAIKNGAAGSTVLHGPGNSQPHKASPCSGGHEVDVHALKGRRAGSCGSTPPHPTPPPGDPNPPGDPKTPVSDPKPAPAHADALAPAAQPTANGEAAGRVAARGEGNSRDVLAATERIGRSAALPFTGDRLWITVLVGLFLIGAGLALRQIRTAEAVVESEGDHTNRADHAARGSRPPVGGRTGR
jgi:hypothetical protein